MSEETASEIENSFWANLKGIKLPKNATIDVKSAKNAKTVPTPNYNTEKLLSSLYDSRDGLIDLFKEAGIESKFASSLTSNINKLGACIQQVGGEVEAFDPFAHISALRPPNLMKNAKRIIENTKEAYSLGSISDFDTEDEGRTIKLTFNGQSGNIKYSATGKISTSKTWTGNEVLEYIYTPGEGRLSVKAMDDNGEWVDKSANYKIAWDLFEGDANDLEGKASETLEIKEEDIILGRNNKEQMIDDFPISQK